MILEAFGVRRGDVVAVVGGGGKTTLRDALIAAARPWRVIGTTTTKSGPVDGALFNPDRAALAAALDRDGCAFVVSARETERRWIGVTPAWIDSARDLADLVVVEADGARRKPLKAPAGYEPVIPPSATLVIAVVGAEAIGARASDALVHRLALSPFADGEPISPEALAAHVESSRGYRKSVPESARFVPFVNKVSRAAPGMVESLVAALESPRVVWGEALEGIFHVRG